MTIKTSFKISVDDDSGADDVSCSEENGFWIEQAGSQIFIPDKAMLGELIGALTELATQA